jgi:hypothetical protein
MIDYYLRLTRFLLIEAELYLKIYGSCVNKGQYHLPDKTCLDSSDTMYPVHG